MSDLMPVLYSFCRCPYAIRARFSLKYAGIKCFLREISLRNKPPSMLKASPKGTVPVLILPDGQIIDESLDIIFWALKQNDPENYLVMNEEDRSQCDEVIKSNDENFVKILHQYKYRDHYPEINFADTEKKMMQWLTGLDERLKENKFLLRERPTAADLALFPFVRQMARIDTGKLKEWNLNKLDYWLRWFYEHPAYEQAMKKFPLWQEGDGEIF